MNNHRYSGDDVLDIMSKYARNRNAEIERLIVKFLGLNDGSRTYRVLEFGAGKGEFTHRIAKRKYINLVAVESDSFYLRDLQQFVEVYSSLEKVPGTFDCIFAIDVLEHLEDDETCLKLFFEKLNTNGKLFVYVPARKELLSSFDKKIGHFRRYSKNELFTKVIEAGFVTETIRYHELLGYFASMINKWLLNGAGLNKTTVRIYDRVLVPLTNILERFITAPVGKSLFISAIRKE